MMFYLRADTHIWRLSDLSPGIRKSMFELRKRSFIDRREWSIESYTGGEEELDAYDKVDTQYIILSSGDECLASVRIIPSSPMSFTASKFGFNLLDAGVGYDKTWEASRFCVNQEVPNTSYRLNGAIDIRTMELFLLMVEIAIYNGIISYEVVIDRQMHKILCRAYWIPIIIGVKHGSKNEKIYHCLLQNKREQLALFKSQLQADNSKLLRS